MFAKLVSATWGEETGAEDDGQKQNDSASEQKESDRPQPTDQDQSGFSLWGVASALADSVRKNTAEVTTGLRETNWRAELEAFGKGVRDEEHQLRKETAKQVEVVKERLPKHATAQMDLKAKELAAHLQKLGVGLGGLGKTLATRTSDLFDQVRDTVVEELSASDKAKGRMKRQGSRPLSKGKYSRLEADISSMQRDSSTYCDEPADTADYQAWRSKFDLATYKPAVEGLVEENAFMAELQARIVPVIVEYDAFWTRYFYRLHLLEARHAQRQKLAQRASKPQPEEELAWDDAEEQPQQPPKPAPKPPSTTPPHPSSSDAPGSATAVSPAHATPSTEAVSHSQAAPDTAVAGASEDQPPSDDPESNSATEGETQRAVSTAGDDSAAETLTGSDSGSGHEHWTVVKSQSKQAAVTADAAAAASAGQKELSSDKAQAEASGKGKSSGPAAKAAAAKADGDTDSEIDDLDDVSNDGELDTSGGPRSEGDEDWGSWE